MTATATAARPTIRQLPPQLVNQIAAGEVIERPASVVKELLENSIDAGATRIDLVIEGGGTELIRISDDGCGIPADELPLAVTSHATSKLPEDESLFHVGTLGFRGEALASIASVSQMTIRSRPESGTAVGGHQIDVRGGVIDPPSPAGCPVGTVIEVKNLFFNTPVRRKFLKTPSTERGHITEAFTRIALANPRVHLTMRSGDKMVHDLPSTTRWSDRIESFFGGEVSEALIKIASDDPPIGVRGFVCDPSVNRGNQRMQYVFLNGRHIRDRSLSHALGEAYRGMMMVGRHPVCFLNLTMPADMVDVNVHPAKLEVRFTDGGRVYSRLLATLRSRFLSTDMTHRVTAIRPSADDAENDHLAAAAETVMGMSAARVDAARQDVIDWARTGQTNPRPAPPAVLPSRGVADFQPFPGGPTRVPPADVAPWDDTNTDSPSHLLEERGPGENSSGSPSPRFGERGLGGEGSSLTRHPTTTRLGIQVHNRYLVTQDESGMVVIDQHALHERVLYERVCQKVLGGDGQLESQRLLVPEPVTLTSAERDAALNHRETLAKIGLELDDFGGDAVVIQSVPAILGGRSPADMLRTVLEAVLGAGRNPDAKDLLDHLLATVACKAAVKAGDPLAPEEITSLLEQKDLYNDTHHCPHGRPTALFFARDELDRMFGRLGPPRSGSRQDFRPPS